MVRPISDLKLNRWCKWKPEYLWGTWRTEDWKILEKWGRERVPVARSYREKRIGEWVWFDPEYMLREMLLWCVRMSRESERVSSSISLILIVFFWWKENDSRSLSTNSSHILDRGVNLILEENEKLRGCKMYLNKKFKFL